MHGEWPSDTAVAIFLFETKEGGKQWFDAFHVNCKLAGLAVVDSVVGATKEPWQIGMHIVLLFGTITSMGKHNWHLDWWTVLIITPMLKK